MKKYSWISEISLYSILLSIILFMVIMLRGTIIGLSPTVELSLILILLVLSLIFSTTGLIKNSENNLLPGISLFLTIAFGIFFLFIYIVSGMSTDY